MDRGGSTFGLSVANATNGADRAGTYVAASSRHHRDPLDPRPGQGWAHGRTVTGIPQAFAVDGTRIYGADDRGIAFTDDVGTTWMVLTANR